MATTKNFGLAGVASSFQVGKRGGSIEWDTDHFSFKGADGSTLTDLRVTQTPASDDSAASKWYVDSVATGLDVKKSVRVLATDPVTASGVQTVDGVTLSEGDRVLLTAQASASANGIYTVAAGAWARSEDADGNPAGEVTSGMFTFVEEGSHAQEGWVLATSDPISLDVTDLTFTQFTGAGQLVGGAGIQLDGGSIIADVDGVTLTNTGGTGSQLSVAGGSDNQVLIGQTGADALWAYVGTLYNASGDAAVIANTDASGSISMDVTAGATTITGAGATTITGGGDVTLDAGANDVVLSGNQVLLPSGYVSTDSNSLMTRSEITTLTDALANGAYQISNDQGDTYVRTDIDGEGDSDIVEIAAGGVDIAKFSTDGTTDAYYDFTHADGEIRIEAASAATADVDIRLVPKGSGNVFIGDTGPGVIQADDEASLGLKGGDTAPTPTADAGDLILEGGDATGAFASGNVLVRPGSVDTGTSGNVKIQAQDESDIAVFNGVDGAVNFFDFNSAATGGALDLAAAGTDTNVDIMLSPKGNGQLLVPTGYVPTDDNSLVTKSFIDEAIASNTDELTLRAEIVGDGTTTSFSIGTLPSVVGKSYYMAKAIVHVTAALADDTGAKIAVSGGSDIVTNDEFDLQVAETFVIDGNFQAAIAGGAEIVFDGFTTAPAVSETMTVTIEYKAVS